MSPKNEKPCSARSSREPHQSPDTCERFQKSPPQPGARTCIGGTAYAPSSAADVEWGAGSSSATSARVSDRASAGQKSSHAAAQNRTLPAQRSRNCPTTASLQRRKPTTAARDRHISFLRLDPSANRNENPYSAG